jgi:alkanesulfonate monooxygenase SsuD/methylene tetrahydromethanopterin reductase-like flavin-dependent oxidoreductase (luciferase family)
MNLWFSSSEQYWFSLDHHFSAKPIQKPSPPIMVGGSGERKTLKIVAKYADACNLFGSAETVKTKLKVLKDHCESVGRDYNSILKTKLGAIVVDDDKEIAKSRVQHAFKGIPEEQINEFVIYGTPEDVSRQIELIEQVGIQYLIVDLEPSRELEALDILQTRL